MRGALLSWYHAVNNRAEGERAVAYRMPEDDDDGMRAPLESSRVSSLGDALKEAIIFVLTSSKSAIFGSTWLAKVDGVLGVRNRNKGARLGDLHVVDKEDAGGCAR